MPRSLPPSRRHEIDPVRRVRRATAALLLACGLSTVPLTTAAAAPADGLTFADPAFRTCVAGNLGMPSSKPISAAQAESLTDLDCGELSPASLAGAEALTNLATLSISYGSTISSLAPLAKLTTLRQLTLPSAKITDLAPLRGLTGLTRLDLSNDPVKSLAPLSTLTRLTYLDITGSSWTTLEPLRPLTSLQRLNADQEGSVDISALAALTGLQRLNLTVPDVRSLAPLRTLTALTQLNVQAAATDISPLAPLRRLQTLSVNVKGGDGAALADKPDLTELSVYGVRLTSFDVLSSSTQLQWLVAVSNGIKDVSALGRLTQLSELILSGVDKADFSSLSQLPALDYVSITESRLGPLSQFNGLAAVTGLELNDNELDSLGGFKAPANLSMLNVSGNHLRDVSTLPCSLLVNALAQTVSADRARVGKPYPLPLRSIPEQTVQVAGSPQWTASGASITYARAGTYRVPFFSDGPPECAGVQFSGVVSQAAAAGLPPKRPPHDR